MNKKEIFEMTISWQDWRYPEESIVESKKKKKRLSESAPGYANRQYGEPLPTIEDTMAEYAGTITEDIKGFWVILFESGGRELDRKFAENKKHVRRAVIDFADDIDVGNTISVEKGKGRQNVKKENK